MVLLSSDSVLILCLQRVSLMNCAVGQDKGTLALFARVLLVWYCINVLWALAVGPADVVPVFS